MFQKPKKMFTHQSKLQNYSRSHIKDEKDPYSCNICRKSFTVPARLTRHYRTHTGEKPFQCEYCNKSFSVKENLSVHRRIHTKERPYKCDVCDSAFEHSGKLHRHMRIHTGERPHKCSICDKRFIQSGQLVIHMRTHTGEKPYICNFCEKGFTCSKQLKVHSRTHTGEKPYTCDICGKSFGYNHVLKLHQVAHYGEKCYKCTICYETFNSKKMMESHIKNHPDSLIADYSVKNEIHLKNTIDRNRVLCNYTNNYEINVKEKKLYHCAKIKNSQSALKIQRQNDVSADINLSKIAPESCYFVLNTNVHTSDNSPNKKIGEPSTRKLTINNYSSTEQYTLTDYDLDNSCLYEIQNNDFFTKTYLTSIRLSNKNCMHRVEDNYDKAEEEPQIDSKKLKSCDVFDSTDHTEFNNQLYNNSINYVISKKKSNHSLPPRKRSQMILESMNTENFKLQRAARYHSVIKFANTKITNSVGDNPICLNS